MCRVSVEPHSSSVDLASTHTHVSLPLDTGAPEKIKLGRVRRPSEREVRIAYPTRDRKTRPRHSVSFMWLGSMRTSTRIGRNPSTQLVHSVAHECYWCGISFWLCGKDIRFQRGIFSDSFFAPGQVCGMTAERPVLISEKKTWDRILQLPRVTYIDTRPPRSNIERWLERQQLASKCSWMGSNIWIFCLCERFSLYFHLKKVQLAASINESNLAEDILVRVSWWLGPRGHDFERSLLRKWGSNSVPRWPVQQQLIQQTRRTTHTLLIHHEVIDNHSIEESSSF